MTGSKIWSGCWVVMLTVVCLAAQVFGATTWTAGDGNWSDDANWSGVEPVSGDTVYIQNGGTALCETGEVAGTLFLGEANGGNGTIRLNDATDTLTVAAPGNVYWGRRATGVVIQTSGTLVISNSTQMGYFATGLAKYDISGGTGILHTITVGNANGNGHVLQSGGLVQFTSGCTIATDGLYELTDGRLESVGSLSINGGRMLINGPSAVWNVAGGANTYIANGVNGVLDLYDGMITNAGSFYVAHQRTGTVTQVGGLVRLRSNKFVKMGTYSTGAWGTWNMYGGALELNYANAGSLTMGDSANSFGTFNMGNASGCGILTQQVAGAGVTVGNNGIGLLRGWSDDGSGNKLYLTGSLTVKKGRIIADGYGTDRALDLASFSGFVNSLDNLIDGNYGCYAQDHGELRLPAITVSGDTTNYWGEQVDQDLVNSAKLVFTGGSGTLTGKLYAVDHGSVNALGDMTAVSVHDFTGAGMTSCDLTIRYDHVAVSNAGLAEADLEMYQWSGSAWSDLAATVTTGSRTIAASGLTSLGQFAIGALPAPPAGTVISIR